jgi:hypothetical protein
MEGGQISKTKTEEKKKKTKLDILKRRNSNGKQSNLEFLI